MKRQALGGFLFLLAASLPSQAAAWRDIGQLSLTPEGSHYVQRLRIPAPVESLKLHAVGGDIDCMSVRGIFRDDTRKVIYHGTVPQNGDALVPLQDSDTSIRTLYVRCSGPDGSTIAVSADPGRFAGEWTLLPYLNPLLTSAYNWGSRLFHGWHLVGLARFHSHFRQTEIAASDPGAAATLALMPVGVDARCTSAAVRFTGGKTEALDIDRNDFLQRNRYYKLSLANAADTLEGIDLTCRATDGNSVTMRVFSGS